MGTLNLGGGTNFVGSNGNLIDAPPGTIIQYKYRKGTNTTFTTASTSMTDLNDFYVDITPRNANNLLVVSTNFTAGHNANSGYARYQIVDANNSDAKWSSNMFMGASHYYAPHSPSQWPEVVLKHTNVAGTTNAMRLQFQVVVASGGTLNLQWSENDDRIVEVYEVAQ